MNYKNMQLAIGNWQLAINNLIKLMEKQNEKYR
jgi:hypothetical protein